MIETATYTLSEDGLKELGFDENHNLPELLSKALAAALAAVDGDASRVVVCLGPIGSAKFACLSSLTDPAVCADLLQLCWGLERPSVSFSIRGSVTCSMQLVTCNL